MSIGVLLFLVTFQVLCGPKLITAEYENALGSRWILTSDFTLSELANLSPMEEHRLLLKSLMERRSDLLINIITYELYAKFAGTEFIGLVEDENANRENTAILKAAFQFSTKLQFHYCFEEYIKIISNILDLNKTSNLGKTFTRICSDYDNYLKNETIYLALRDEYKKKDFRQPGKIYLYNIPKSEDDFRISLMKFFNDPQLKKLFAHMTFFTMNVKSQNKQWPVKYIIMELIKLPGKLEIVQKIYDESIQVLTSLVCDVHPANVNFYLNVQDTLTSILYYELEKRIMANADLNMLVKDLLASQSK
ncbi:hypothetical protein V9T40_005720 [Parthenolecanium corni]|uniref:Uncharacterized protein n=1 Tax=Parthenolecanium corni TaxID=536013 RepID=A0AAN9YAR6_9HEMI